MQECGWTCTYPVGILMNGASFLFFFIYGQSMQTYSNFEQAIYFSQTVYRFMDIWQPSLRLGDGGAGLLDI